jgi:hypothetical protein
VVIGWQGVSVRVPADWTLGGVGGERKAGYLRVDDDHMPRLQVKWSQGRIDLARKRDEYVKRLTTGRRKLGRLRRPSVSVEVATDLRAVSRRSKPRKEFLSFAWRGRECGIGLLWNCEVCRRAVIAQVSWLQQESFRETAQEVLESLEDHGEGGWQVWAVDGLAFLAPERLQLEGWKRLTGYLELRLSEGQNRLKVARWGMVPLIMGNQSIGEWFEKQNRHRQDATWQAQEMAIKEHSGVAAWGEQLKLVGGLRTKVARRVRRLAPLLFAACAWHCPQSNRLYQVETVEGEGRRGAPAPTGEVLKGVVDSITCHGGSG